VSAITILKIEVCLYAAETISVVGSQSSKGTLPALVAFATISVDVHSVAVSKIVKAKREWIGFAANVLLVLRTVGEAWRNRHVCFEPTYGYTFKEGLE
jgi:hypothetical protein